MPPSLLHSSSPHSTLIPQSVPCSLSPSLLSLEVCPSTSGETGLLSDNRSSVTPLNPRPPLSVCCSQSQIAQWGDVSSWGWNKLREGRGITSFIRDTMAASHIAACHYSSSFNGNIWTPAVGYNFFLPVNSWSRSSAGETIVQRFPSPQLPPPLWSEVPLCGIQRLLGWRRFWYPMWTWTLCATVWSSIVAWTRTSKTCPDSPRLLCSGATTTPGPSCGVACAASCSDKRSLTDKCTYPGCPSPFILVFPAVLFITLSLPSVCAVMLSVFLSMCTPSPLRVFSLNACWLLFWSDAAPTVEAVIQHCGICHPTSLIKNKNSTSASLLWHVVFVCNSRLFSTVILDGVCTDEVENHHFTKFLWWLRQSAIKNNCALSHLPLLHT